MTAIIKWPFFLTAPMISCARLEVCAKSACNAVLLASAPRGAKRYRESMDTGSWHQHENAPARWMTSPVTRAAKAQSRCAKPRICPEPSKHDTVFFFLLSFIIFFFAPFAGTANFPKERVPRPLFSRAVSLGATEETSGLGSVGVSPLRRRGRERLRRGAGSWPRDGRRRTQLDGHILWRDKSFPTAPNETSIIHAVSFFQSTNHVGSFRGGRSPLLQTATPHLSVRGTLCHMRV